MNIVTKSPEQAELRWLRAIRFRGELSVAAARGLLKFGFSEEDHVRMAELSTMARVGTLSLLEQAELDFYERLGCVLDILHSKARQVLKKKPRRAS